MSHHLTKEEEELLKLCRQGTAPIREFTALLGRRVRLNIHDQVGWHPLVWVSYHGRSDLADLFIQHRAEVDLATADKLGETALITASAKGHLETVKLLLHRGASVNFQRKTGTTALYFSSKNNHVEVVKYLLNSGAQVNKGSQTPLYGAAYFGAPDAAKVLLDHGADVNQPTDDPNNICSSPLGTACEHNHPQVALLLINHGANINYQDGYGNTPLHWASQNGHSEVAKILVQSQASVNVKSKLGNTPLHMAVINGHLEVVRLLLLSQANMKIKNNAGKTPLKLAKKQKYKDIVHLLKTGVPAQPAGVSMSDEVGAGSLYTLFGAEAGDGEEGKEQSSMEGLTSEQKNDDHSQVSAAAAVWKLPGVEECDETSVVICFSQGQLIKWNGLKLHIHASSLPEGLQQCTIYIRASISGEYEFPEGTSLVSAVYWVRCEPQCIFTKPITVEIQHCSTKQDLSKLKIVRAFCSQKELPYYFKPLGGGRFDANTAYGAIEVKGFSGFGVTEESPSSQRLYYNQLFFCSNLSHQQIHNVEIHIVFTWNTEPHINYISQKYPEEQGFHADCYQVVELVGSEIRVDLIRAKWTKIMDGQWEILPKKAVVTKTELDDFKPQRGIPNLILLARPLCENFDHLLHEINLIGIKPPYNELTLYYMPSIRGNQLSASVHTDPATSDAVSMQQPQELATDRKTQRGNHLPASMHTDPATSDATMGVQQPQELAKGRKTQQAQVGCLSPNDLRKVLRTIWEARTEWYNLGLELDITPDTLDAIEQANVLNPDRCFRAMLTKWLREHNQPTWSALAEALTSPSVGLSHLAQEILEQ